MEAIKVNHWIQYINEHPNFTGCLINKDNIKAWYKDGKWHREDGPAMEYVNGSKYWYLNDVRYNSEQEWIIAMRKIKIEKVLKQIEG